MIDWSQILFIVLLAVAVFLSLPRSVKMKIGETFLIDTDFHQEKTREEIDAELEEMYKDLTDTYTPAERKRMEQEEKENYNKNIRPAYFWAGADTWIDADGNEREF